MGQSRNKEGISNPNQKLLSRTNSSLAASLHTLSPPHGTNGLLSKYKGVSKAVLLSPQLGTHTEGKGQRLFSPGPSKAPDPADGREDWSGSVGEVKSKIVSTLTRVPTQVAQRNCGLTWHPLMGSADSALPAPPLPVVEPSRVSSRACGCVVAFAANTNRGVIRYCCLNCLASTTKTA
jgi:hypothetical protein